MSLRATAAAFVKEGGIGLAIVVLLSLVVWLGGDYFGLSPLVAQAVIAAMVGLSVAMFVVRRLLARRQAKRLAAKFMELAAQDADATLGERKAKQEEIAALLREGVAHLRMSEHGEKAVSDLPWYLVVGTPGSGKSTLLEQSGLSFTPMGRVRKPVSEAGTTRDLDWWLTDSAVFLDVPGRYISSLDSPFEWPAFVGALKEARAHAPVSGVIIVLPVPEILDLKNDEVEPYAKNIRDRLDELSAQCRWVFPVYVVFSKCDAMAGFSEAFSNLPGEQRGQPWGATLPFKIDENRNYRTVFHDECNRLSEPLRERILAALSIDAPPATKERTALFPRQVFLAQRRMGEVLGAVFRPNPFIETGLLRGFYFTSAAQGGVLHDLVKEAKETPPLTAVSPWFMARLFADILPPDRHLARLSFKEHRRRRALATALGTGALAASLLFGVLMLLSFLDHRRAMEGVLAARAQSDESERMESLRRALVAADEPRTLARAIPFGGAEARAIEAARKDYGALARKRVTQPVADEIQRQLRQLRERGYGSIADYDAALDATLALRLLAGKAPGAADSAKARLVEAARACARGETSREALWIANLDYLLADKERLAAAAPAIDSALMESVDQDLKGALWVQAAYLDVLREAPPLTAVKRDALIAGPGRDYVVLAVEVPGIYTQRGYDDYVGVAIKRKAEALASRLAALGQEKPAWSIAAEITDRYADEHAAAWAKAQASFAAKDFDGLDECALALKSLTGRDSAIRELLVALLGARALKLQNGQQRNASGDDLKWLDAALAPLAKIPAQLETMLQNASGPDPVLDYLAQGKLDSLIAALNEAARATDDALAGAPRELRAHYQLVFDRLLEGAARELCQQAQLEAERLWLGALSGFEADCGDAFPFNADSAREAPMNTVARYLNPKNGRFAAAVARLRALRSCEVTVGHIPDTRRYALVVFSKEFEQALERLSEMQEALFAGGESISVRFAVAFSRTPGVDDISLSAGSKSRGLNDAGSGELAWTQDNATSVKLQARVAGQWLARDYATRDWGLLRLLAEAERTSPDTARLKCTWRFAQDGRNFDVSAELDFKSGRALEPALFSTLGMPQKVGP